MSRISSLGQLPKSFTNVSGTQLPEFTTAFAPQLLKLCRQKFLPFTPFRRTSSKMSLDLEFYSIKAHDLDK